MTFIERMGALVDRLAAGEMFADATLSRPSRTFDPITGTVTQTASPTPCRAVAKETVIRGDDGALERRTVITLTVEPQEGDIVELGDLTFALGAITAVAPHGTPLIWRAVAQ